MSDEEARWGPLPQKSGVDHCAEPMRARKRVRVERTSFAAQECKTEGVRRRRRQASINRTGGRWAIESMKEKIWRTSEYECIRRGEIPGDGVKIEYVQFHSGDLLYFDEKASEFAMSFDDRVWEDPPTINMVLRSTRENGASQFHVAI